MIRTSYFAGSGVTPLIEVKPDATNPRKKGTRKPGKYSRAAAIGLAAPTPRAFGPGCPPKRPFFCLGRPQNKKTRHVEVCGFSAECGAGAWCCMVLLVGATGVEPVTYAL